MQDQHPRRFKWIIETIDDIIVFSNNVKISVKLFRVYLGMVTSFWSTFVLEGVM